MALARLALKNLQKRFTPPPSSNSLFTRHATPTQKQSLSSELSKPFSTAAEEKPQSQEISVSESSKKPKPFPRRRRRSNTRPTSLWRNNNRDLIPPLWEFFPSGLGDALLQATDNINRLLESLPPHESSRGIRFKEQDECYKVRYEVPGLSKDDLKITVEDGVLRIKGEHKEEDEQRSDEFDDEYWSSRRSYGYYDGSVVLPDDVRIDGINAELKDGVLNVIIPRAEREKKDVKEIQVS